ncbi:MAG: class I SAM-dependent methyltransferase [Planctomycetota bacterium]|nr:class I SAM-dependent methyltransferase [Planctomycetota bacterium]
MSSDPAPPNRTGAEFDAYAAGYGAGMDNPLKRMAGPSAETFIEIKVRWLALDLARRPLHSAHAGAPPRLLDCGCGSATLLRLIARAGMQAELHGCDISQGMLDEARRTWTQGPAPDLRPILGQRLPYDDASFDVVVASAVLHHIPLDERAEFYRQVARILRPGGRFLVFEHNPFNPVTRWVVSHTPIDANAILLRPGEVQRGMRDAGLAPRAARSLMFVPPRWRWAWALEDWIAWLPLGGQYAQVGEKPTGSK